MGFPAPNPNISSRLKLAQALTKKRPVCRALAGWGELQDKQGALRGEAAGGDDVLEVVF